MFKKEAEEYFETECLHSYADTEEQLKEDVVPAFQKGAEFGYNRAKKRSASIIKRLIENKPNTYIGSDVMANQKRMFAFSSAVNDAIEYLKEVKDEY